MIAILIFSLPVLLVISGLILTRRSKDFANAPKPKIKTQKIFITTLSVIFSIQVFLHIEFLGWYSLIWGAFVLWFIYDGLTKKWGYSMGPISKGDFLKRITELANQKGLMLIPIKNGFQIALQPKGRLNFIYYPACQSGLLTNSLGRGADLEEWIVDLRKEISNLSFEKVTGRNKSQFIAGVMLLILGFLGVGFLILLMLLP